MTISALKQWREETSENVQILSNVTTKDRWNKCYLFLSSWAGGIQQILQSDWFLEWAEFSHLDLHHQVNLFLWANLLPFLHFHRWLTVVGFELASNADILWTGHAIFIPQECLLKQTAHSFPFVHKDNYSGASQCHLIIARWFFKLCNCSLKVTCFSLSTMCGTGGLSSHCEELLCECSARET